MRRPTTRYATLCCARRCVCTRWSGASRSSVSRMCPRGPVSAPPAASWSDWYTRQPVAAETLACEAIDIEMNRLGEPVGKQDQYIAAYGGLTCQEYRPDDSVAVIP